MNKEDTQIGKRYSHLYLQRGEAVRDSIRFRNRLAAFVIDSLDSFKVEIRNEIRREIGINIAISGTGYYDWQSFFDAAELKDILDAVTIIWHVLKRQLSVQSTSWLNFVKRVFEEENLGYRIDEECGVHYFVDEEFERNRFSALGCLMDARYAAVYSVFEEAYHKLDTVPSDTKGSIRSIFEAVEILYKLIINSEAKDRLNSLGIQKNLKPIVQVLYSKDRTAYIVSEHLLDGLCDWINAAHMYRHGQKAEETSIPPIGLAIEMVSQGAAYIRWLTDLDAFWLNYKK